MTTRCIIRSAVCVPIFVICWLLCGPFIGIISLGMWMFEVKDEPMGIIRWHVQNLKGGIKSIIEGG